MKPFQLQTYYELLEVPVSATTDEIRLAYQRLSSQYADDQVALYGLVDSGSATALRARLLEAMEILTDDDLRIEYDKDLGLPARRKSVAEDEEAAPAQLAMNDLLTGADLALQSTHPYVPFSYVTAPAPASIPDPVPTPVPPVVVTASMPPVSAPLPPLPAPSAPAPVAVSETIAPPPPSVPPPQASPRPPPALAPEISETVAIAVAESELAKVHHVVAAKEARASAPRPKPPDLPPDTEFNGELLRTVRTGMGVTLQQISDKTRISIRHLESIEADKYASLPAPVYLRGILMNLARELGLDGLKVAKSYLALAEKAKG